MKKNFFLFFFLFSFTIYAQVASDIHDYFYKDLQRWETIGLVSNLPQTKPYPLQVIKVILESVIEKGDVVQQQIAQEHYNRFFIKQMLVGGKSEVAFDVNTSKKQLGLALCFDLNYEVSPLLTASASIDAWAINKLPKDEIVPYTEFSNRDIIDDTAKLGPFWVLPSINSSSAFGTHQVYIHTGLMRGSFGPVHQNGLIVGPQALHTAQAHFYIDKNQWAFGTNLYGLAATSLSDLEYFQPNKFLNIHYLEFRPTTKFNVSIIESVVYGQRFDPSYILPFTPYIVTQGIYGFDDNSWLGLMASYKPIAGLKLDAVFYADDLHFKDMVRLKLDTKWRTAQQINIAWAPQKSGILNLIQAHYTQVMPYTYSHRIGEDEKELFESINYQNYTHAGLGYGSSLEPNSDRLKLSIGLTPLEKLDVDIFGIFIRHGNPNENIEEKRIKEFVISDSIYDYRTDGSINNNTWTDAGHAAQDHSPFLNQKHLRHNVQVGFDINCRLPVLKTGGYMVFKFGFTYELDINPGVSKPIYIRTQNVDELNWESTAEQQYTKWKENLGGKNVHNYIRLGFEYYF